MSINSHIQLPNGILKYFRDETDPEKKVWYLDINSRKIGRKPAGKLGTSKGYYSDEIEKHLNVGIENPITMLNAKIRAFAEGKTDAIEITSDEISDAKRYIKASIMRSGMAMDTLLNSSYTAAFCTAQENHDDLVYVGLSSDTIFDDYLKSMSFCILVNRTETHFVVPRNCFYLIPSRGYITVIAPISPTAAIALYSPDYPENINGCYGTIDNPSSISVANQYALQWEFELNKEFVAADRKVELEELLVPLENVYKWMKAT